MRTAEEYRKNPIFGTDFSKPVPVIIEEIRVGITKLRGNIQDIVHGYPGYSESLKHVEGLLTCGLSCLYTERERIIDSEIKRTDQKRGRSFSFKSRGVGMDHCPGCFVCGGSARIMNNISAFVKSKTDGEEAVDWFGQGAQLDFHEPSWIQVKVGACKEHLPALEKLDRLLRDQYDVLRKVTIEDAKSA